MGEREFSRIYGVKRTNLRNWLQRKEEFLAMPPSAKKRRRKTGGGRKELIPFTQLAILLHYYSVPY